MRSFMLFVLAPLGALGSSCATSEMEEVDSASLLQKNRVQQKEEPVEDPAVDQYGREYNDNFEHRINAQAQLVQAKVTDNAGNSHNGYLDWAKYSQHRVCVGATNTGQNAEVGHYLPEFNLEEPMCFKKLSIIYLAGHVTCRTAAHGKSHFGCDEDSIGLVLAKETNTAGEYDLVFPKPVRDTADDDERNANIAWNAANIQGYSHMGHGHADWYQLAGYDGDTTNIQLKLNPAEEGGVFLSKGKYRLWYHENLVGDQTSNAQGTEHDNSGIACYHLDFQLCQGTEDAAFTLSTLPPSTGKEAPDEANGK